MSGGRGARHRRGTGEAAPGASVVPAFEMPVRRRSKYTRAATREAPSHLVESRGAPPQAAPATRPLVRRDCRHRPDRAGRPSGAGEMRAPKARPRRRSGVGGRSRVMGGPFGHAGTARQAARYAGASEPVNPIRRTRPPESRDAGELPAEPGIVEGLGHEEGGCGRQRIAPLSSAPGARPGPAGGGARPWPEERSIARRRRSAREADLDGSRRASLPGEGGSSSRRK